MIIFIHAQRHKHMLNWRGVTDYGLNVCIMQPNDDFFPLRLFHQMDFYIPERMKISIVHILKAGIWETFLCNKYFFCLSSLFLIILSSFYLILSDLILSYLISTFNLHSFASYKVHELHTDSHLCPTAPSDGWALSLHPPHAVNIEWALQTRMWSSSVVSDQQARSFQDATVCFTTSGKTEQPGPVL